MAPRNPVARITGAAGAATLPLKAAEKVAERAVGVVAGGVRVASRLIHSTTRHARSMVGAENEKDAPAPPDAPAGAPSESPAPGPVTAPPAMPLESVEELAEAAVAREMAEEPHTSEPEEVTSTTTGAARKTAAASDDGAPDDDEPLIDPATAKAVKSETDILRAAADLDTDH